MTDREKLMVVFEAFDIEMSWYKFSLVANERRFYFNEEGEITDIVDAPRRTA